MKRFTVGNITRGYLNPTVAQRLHSNSLIALKPSTAPKPTYDPVKEYKKAFYALANAPSRNRAEEEDLLKSYYKSMVDKMAETKKEKKKKNLWARMKSMIWAEQEEEEHNDGNHVEHIAYDEFVTPDHQPPLREILNPNPPPPLPQDPHPVFGTIPDTWGRRNEQKRFVRVEPLPGSNIPYDDVSAEIAQYERMYHTGQIDETDRAAALVQAAKHTVPARSWINPIRDDYNPYAPYASSVPYYYYRDPSQRAAAAAAVAAADGIGVADDVVLYDEANPPPPAPPPPPPPAPPAGPILPKALKKMTAEEREEYQKKVAKERAAHEARAKQDALVNAMAEALAKRRGNKTPQEIEAQLQKEKEERKTLQNGTEKLWLPPSLQKKREKEDEGEEVKLGNVMSDEDAIKDKQKKEAKAAAKALKESVRDDMAAFVNLLGTSEGEVYKLKNGINPQSYSEFANYLRDVGLKSVEELPEIIPPESKFLRETAINVGFALLNTAHRVLEKRAQLRYGTYDTTKHKEIRAEKEENLKDLKQFVADLNRVSDDLRGFLGIEAMKAVYDTAQGLLYRITNSCDASEFRPGEEVKPNVLFDDALRKRILESGIRLRSREAEIEKLQKQNVESVLPPKKPLPKKPLPKTPKSGSGSFDGFSLPLKRGRYSYF